MSKFDLSKPTRQSVKGLVLIFVQGLRQLVRMFWPLLLAFVFQKKLFDNTVLLGIVVVAILLLIIVHSILFYLNFYFYVTEKEFVLKKGYLRKKVLTIPFDRIQSVNSKQNLIQQLLDVVTLEIDTAGTIAKELKIHALEKSFAIELQKQIQVGKTINKNSSNEGEEKEEEAPEKLIMKLTPADLLKIGISQNHLRTGLIILAFGNQIYQNVRDLFKEKANEYSSELSQFLSNSDWALIAFLIIFFLLISILFSLFRTVFKYFDFKLLKKNETFRVESGLMNKRNVIVPYNKVQELYWETGPIKRLFGIYHLVFKQAVSGQNKRNQLVDAPGCLSKHLELLKFDLFGEDQIEQLGRIYTNRFYFRRLWFISGWIPSLLCAPFFYTEWLYYVLALSWLLITSIYSFLMLKKRYFQMNNNQIRISKGAISHNWKQMELFKIQSVEFRQSIFQKRRGLASLNLTNASGALTIPYIEESVAKQIYDYLLYHTEVSTKSWM
jgi:putative membrane protein